MSGEPRRSCAVVVRCGAVLWAALGLERDSADGSECRDEAVAVQMRNGIWRCGRRARGGAADGWIDREEHTGGRNEARLPPRGVRQRGRTVAPHRRPACGVVAGLLGRCSRAEVTDRLLPDQRLPWTVDAPLMDGGRGLGEHVMWGLPRQCAGPRSSSLFVNSETAGRAAEWCVGGARRTHPRTVDRRCVVADCSPKSPSACAHMSSRRL